MIVGGHAVAVHARPRVTEDLDVFVEASKTNARRLRRVLSEFGFGDAAPSEATLATRGKVFMIGVPPFRIDILTSISGVTFASAWRTRVRVALDPGKLPFISRALLVRNKRASGRPKDLADLQMPTATRPPPKRHGTKRPATKRRAQELGALGSALSIVRRPNIARRGTRHACRMPRATPMPLPASPTA